jgi:DNA-binding transcriptional LysR family regulator
LTIASTPRCFQEDLPAGVDRWLRDRPHVRLTFLELRDDEVMAAVAAAAADFGITSLPMPDSLPAGLAAEPGYELETLLITARNHPLARKQRIRPADLRRYPILSSPYTLSDEPDLNALLERRGVFDGPAPPVEPFFAATLRSYVERNMGIALVYGILSKGRRSVLHERSMSNYFGRGLIRFVFRCGAATEEHARSLGAAIRENCYRGRRPERTKS